MGNVWGSCAGSGSDAFPIYRRHRNHEFERLEKMDREWDELREAEAFQNKREAHELADDKATAIKRAKRQRRKQAKITNERLIKEGQGINKFESDGSFMEKMQSLAPEELEAVLKESTDAR